MKTSTVCMGLLAALSLPSAQAANVEIRALFQPDSSQPGKNVFVNKTPSSGYCGSYPAECAANNIFSIQLPVHFDGRQEIRAGDSISLKAPANWRQLTVTNKDTQETEIVEVRIIGIGSDFMLSHSVIELTGETVERTAHQKLWTSSSWVNTPAPCLYSGVGVFTKTSYRFFWKTPVEAACTKVAAFTIPHMSFNTLDFAYELRTPNPLGMSSGLYDGSLTYTLGPGGDFDLGPVFNPDDSSLTLDFVLDVQHTLKVDLPAGGNTVSLEPEGGWRSWIDSGRKPTRLYRDQLFYISASTRFKVHMFCGNDGYADCMVRDPVSQRAAAVQLSISLPNGLMGADGQPVKRTYLRSGVVNALRITPSAYVDRKPGTLHFDMSQSYIDYIVQPGMGGSYSGAITVVWDSET
ncbi:hypothetical protein [Pseudomonas sp.]|uniref:hypothetical protein n=1 Tax=Pseudomonas sp. TaxID=306 RepID=UPI003BB78C6D